MPQWDIPHDEVHRFLDWGERDEVFYDWCNYFTKKEIKYEIGGGGERWTIYKHMLFSKISSTRVNRCCPMEGE